MKELVPFEANEQFSTHVLMLGHLSGTWVFRQGMRSTYSRQELGRDFVLLYILFIFF